MHTEWSEMPMVGVAAILSPAPREPAEGANTAAGQCPIDGDAREAAPPAMGDQAVAPGTPSPAAVTDRITESDIQLWFG